MNKKDPGFEKKDYLCVIKEFREKSEHVLFTYRQERWRTFTFRKGTIMYSSFI